MVRTQKSSSLILLLLAVFSITACKSSKNVLSIAENYQLVYNLNAGGEPYNFIVEVTQKQPDLAFKFSMTNQNKTSGDILISGGDLDTAHGMNNYFQSGHTELKKQTTVWLSKRCFNEIATSGRTYFTFPMGFGSKTDWFKKESTEDFMVSINGTSKVVPTIVIRNEKVNSQFIRILNNPNDPLILEMDLGFKIGLKEINYSK